MRRLLDDESPKVRQAVVSELVDWGEDGVSFLREISKSVGPSADAAVEILGELGCSKDTLPFCRFIHVFAYELESGFLLLDKLIRPALDSGAIGFELDEMTNRVEELTVLPNSSRECCRIVSRVLFHEYGLHGAQGDFHNPLQSSLSFALEPKGGLPITLCVLFLMVARRVGLELDPVGFPGRFMVGCFLEEVPFYVDACEGGEMRDPDEVASLLQRGNLDDSAQWFLPMTGGEVLRRACRNLTAQYLRSGEQESARLFSSFDHEFDEAYRRATGQ
ncbi:MAG: transglutaminase-like domain-containing protein [Opitutales bacterium]